GVYTGTVTTTFTGVTATLQLQIDGERYNAFTSPHTFTGLAAGTHTVNLQDANACTTTLTSTLTQPSAITLTLTKNDGCAGQSSGTITATFSGGTGPYTVQLDSGTFTTSASPKTFTSVALGAHTVTAKDANGCTSTQSITLVDPPALS